MVTTIRRKRHEAAVTLVELLVVISIIVILIALVLPSMTKAGQLSQLTVCADNLRQQCMAFVMCGNQCLTCLW